MNAGGAMLAGEMRGREAPRLVFVHGFGGSRATWDRVWAALPPALPVLRYDQRGFGASIADDAPFSHADDLLAVLDDRGIARAHLVGLSMGGATVLNFALNHPERVERLVLVSPAMVGWEWSDAWMARWKRLIVAARAGNMALARRLWWQHELFDTTRAGDAAAELRRAIDAFAGRQWIADRQRHELPDIDRLAGLSAPALLLTGARDLPDFRLIADLIAAAAPDVRRIDFPEAGHMLPLERPDEVAAAITA
ncbi:MAG: alpha/beta fold hydrolase [Novosphingobium sp.]|nr:alpha/beta fold hydrolase [Novosphingobium sp.]